MAEAQASLLAGLLQHIGHTVWQCSGCENNLTNWVVVALRKVRGIGVEAARPIIQKAEKLTFGQALRELRDGGVLDAALMSRLEKLVDDRNWVVHRLVRENPGLINDVDAVSRIATRLDQIADEALQLNKILGHLFEEMVVSHGVDRAVIDAEAARLQLAWGYEQIDFQAGGDAQAASDN